MEPCNCTASGALLPGLPRPSSRTSRLRFDGERKTRRSAALGLSVPIRSRSRVGRAIAAEHSRCAQVIAAKLDREERHCTEASFSDVDRELVMASGRACQLRIVQVNPIRAWLYDAGPRPVLPAPDRAPRLLAWVASAPLNDRRSNSVSRNKIPLASKTERGCHVSNKKRNRTPRRAGHCQEEA